ncbi:MAG: zinc ribbon domain-containing protein [Caldimonas sp.]
MTDAASPTPNLAGLPPVAFGSVLQAIGGLRNRRALLALLGCLIVGVVVAMLAGRLGGIGSLLGALIMFIAAGTGINAAGVLLMDQARGTPQRGLVDALVYGLMCIPKLIVLGLALLLVAIAVFIVIAIVFLICKIPVLGPVLFVVAFPLSVVIAGMTVCGLFLCMLLALPAIWEGLTVMRAIAQTLTIARTRLVEALLLLAVVWLLCLFVGLVVFGILGSGMIPTLGMSASILGGGGFGGMESMFGMMQGYGGYGAFGGGGSGYAIAGAIGGGLLWALASTLIWQVFLLGLNLVYLRMTEGLDSAATEAALMRGLDDAKRRTAELGERAKAAANRGGQPGLPPAYTAPPAGPVAPTNPTAPTNPIAPIAPAAGATPATYAPPAPTSAPDAPTQAYPPPPAYAPPPQTPPQVPSPPAPTYVPSATAIACPNCSAACTTDDLFCGVCGQRLK